MCSQVCPTWLILCPLVSHHPTFVIEGVVLIDFRDSGEKLEKYINDFFLPLCAATTTEILRCSKLLQNIKIKLLCYKFVHLYTRKILRSRVILCFHIRHIEFEPAGSAVTPNPRYFRMALSAREDRDSHCTPVVQSLLDNFLLGIF